MTGFELLRELFRRWNGTAIDGLWNSNAALPNWWRFGIGQSAGADGGPFPQMGRLMTIPENAWLSRNARYFGRAF
jgi:hypothetical protein